MNEEKTPTLTTADLAGASPDRDENESELNRELNELPVETALPATGESTAPKEPLIPDGGSSQVRWEEIQARFVDEPKESVEQADGLVAEVIQQLASTFAEERSKLESQWQGGGQASTEDLRLALQHYRDFFQRLLAA
jgi:hypothetical protein